MQWSDGFNGDSTQGRRLEDAPRSADKPAQMSLVEAVEWLAKDTKAKTKVLQEWCYTENGNKTLYGILVVYVDDLLLQAKAGPIRDSLLATIRAMWQLGK